MSEIKQLHHNGAQLYVRPDSSDFKAFREVIVKQGYQHGFRDTKARFEIMPGEMWLDLGANIGAFTVWAGLRGAKIMSYEPEAACFEMLKANIELNRVIAQPIQAAVVAGDQKTMKLSVGEPGNEWRSSVLKFKSSAQKIATQKVDCLNIKKVLTPEIAGVKMDIEGAEIEILQKLEDYKNVHKLVFEWHFDHNNETAVFWAVIKKLQQHFLLVKHAKIPADLKYYNFFPPATIVYCLGRKNG